MQVQEAIFCFFYFLDIFTFGNFYSILVCFGFVLFPFQMVESRQRVLTRSKSERQQPPQALGHRGRASVSQHHLPHSERSAPGCRGAARWPEPRLCSCEVFQDPLRSLTAGGQGPCSRDHHLGGLRGDPRAWTFNHDSACEANSHPKLRTLGLEQGVNEAKVPDCIPKGLSLLAVPCACRRHAHLSHRTRRGKNTLSPPLSAPPLHTVKPSPHTRVLVLVSRWTHLGQTIRGHILKTK